MTSRQQASPRELWDKIRSKRREAWRSGKRVRGEVIVRQLPSLKDDPRVIAELAYQEFCLREEEGERPEPEVFFTRFPDCHTELKQLFKDRTDSSDGDSGYRDTVEIPLRGSTCTGLHVADVQLDEEGLGKGRKFGRYLLIDQLGEGAMGVVFLARDTALDRPVALKFPRFSEKDLKAGQRVRFYREARAAAAIDHPNICPIYDIGEVNDQDYIAMAYVAGPTLEEMIRELGPVDVREALQIIRDVASALDECHLHGVVHRDLKPSNIVVNHRGAPVVMDFGLAAVENAARVTNDEQVIGTLRYMSPEQVLGQMRDVGPWSDIYGLGATLYESITARARFKGSDSLEIYEKIRSEEPPPPSSVIPGLDPEVDRICAQAMAKKPKNRFRSMAEFAAALDALVSQAG